MASVVSLPSEDPGPEDISLPDSDDAATLILGGPDSAEAASSQAAPAVPVQLPSKCGCGNYCLDPFDRDPRLRLRLLEWDAEKAALGREEYNDLLYQLLRAMRVESLEFPNSSTRGARFRLQFLGQQLCWKAWQTITGIGNCRMQRLLKALKADRECP